MAIDVRDLATRPLEPVIAEELDIFERTTAEYLDGRVDEDTFRVFRLNHGVYGQRQGGRNQMLRVKIPHGRITPEQLDTFAYIAENYSRGWGHLTTRQNMQFHFIQLEQSPEILRLMASVGLTSREACGDTVRNVMGCHLAGACPQEVLDITPWAQGHHRLPAAPPVRAAAAPQVQGQLLRLRDRLRPGDVQRRRRRRLDPHLPDGTTEAGFRVFIAGGLGANPHPAQALEDFTPREELMPTIYSCLRTFDHYGNRDNKIRARMKWLVDTDGASTSCASASSRSASSCARRATGRGGIPDIVLEARRRARGRHARGHQGRAGVRPGEAARERSATTGGSKRNVVRGVEHGTISAVAYSRLGDITADQFRALADIQRDFGLDIRITNRQNLALRDLAEADVRALYDRLNDIGMAEAGAELARDVV